MVPIEKRSYSEIKKLCKDIEKSCNSVFYRGTKVNYLLPSIVPKQNKLDIIHLLEIEKKLLKVFRNIYPHKFVEDDATNDWLYRIRAREHELASRLIDWSHTFYKSLDFATKHLNTESEYGYLWILQMNTNELLPFSDFKNYPIKNLSSTFMLKGIKYNKDNELATHRQFVQGGNFLIQPPYLVTSALNKQPLFFNKLLCIKISAMYASEIREDIVKFEHEDISQDPMIEKENCFDLICKSLNEKLLYSVNDKIGEYHKSANI
jgi:hypothetical protein